jgi:hypothetical protein
MVMQFSVLLLTLRLSKSLPIFDFPKAIHVFAVLFSVFKAITNREIQREEGGFRNSSLGPWVVIIPLHELHLIVHSAQLLQSLSLNVIEISALLLLLKDLKHGVQNGPPRRAIMIGGGRQANSVVNRHLQNFRVSTLVKGLEELRDRLRAGGVKTSLIYL